MKILYLYSEIMPYQMEVFKYLVKLGKAEIAVVHWDASDSRLTPYSPDGVNKVNFYPRSKYDNDALSKFSLKYNPDIVYVSGWQDFGYLLAVRKLKKLGKPVVSGFDDQWLGSFKQVIGSYFMRLFLRNLFFTHAWISGDQQYLYAKKMGFQNGRIIRNLLSCDAGLFHSSSLALHKKEKSYPRTFLYVGSFRHIKGVDILIEAYHLYKQKYKGDWNLICVGNGELEGELLHVSGITVIPFSTQDVLMNLAKEVGAFIMPSRLDQWGVAAHEFASAGLPIILSENVGASSSFLIHNYNGYIYQNNSVDELVKFMLKMSSNGSDDLMEMGRRSKFLSNRISPELTAASLLSIL